MRRLGIIAAAMLVAAAAPGSARAADATLQATTPGGQPVQLDVRDTTAGVCLATRIGAEPPRRTAACFPAPAGAARDVEGVHVVYRATPEKIGIVHGVLSPQTAKLQLRFADGQLVELTPQGEARAYLTVIRGRPALASTRAVDAGGRDLAAADVDPRALALKPRRSATLLRTRDERGARATLTAFTTPLLRPGSLRRRPATCVAVAARSGVPASGVEPGYSGGSACTFDRSRIVVKYAVGCERARLLLFGLAPVAVNRFEVVTHTGLRFRATTERLPRRLRRRGRAFILSMNDPGPLKSLNAYFRGRRVASLPLTSVGSACGSSRRS